LRAYSSTAYKRYHFRVCRKCNVRRDLLFDAAVAQDEDVQRYAELDPFLGVAADHSGGSHHVALRSDYFQGIRGTRMAYRHCYHRYMGGMGMEHDRHDHQTSRTSHVCRHMVL